MDKILITGGAGFIGSHLTEKLVEKGYDIKILDNCFRGSKRNLSKVAHKIEFVEGDILDASKVRESFEDVETVFHLAAINGTRYFYEIPHKVLEVNVKGTLNVLDAVLSSDVNRVIFSSSSEVYGTPEYFPTDEKHKMVIQNPENPRFSYAGSKIIGELLLLNYAKKYGFEAVILRPHNVYGPRMGYEHVIPEFIRRIVLKEKFIIQGDGSQTRSFCFISDAVSGFILAASVKRASNQIFNLGNNEEISMLELARMIASIAEVEINPVFNPLREGSTPRRKPDITKAKRILGYEPKVPLAQGLKITYNWYEEHLSKKIG